GHVHRGRRRVLRCHRRVPAGPRPGQPRHTADHVVDGPRRGVRVDHRHRARRLATGDTLNPRPMDDRPRNLKTMLSEAKDTSELMVDLAYAALYFGDPDMAEEVDELEVRLSGLVHEMRAVCVLAARSLRDADA